MANTSTAISSNCTLTHTFVHRSLKRRYLIKADDDTFMCFKRMAAHVHALPAETRAKIYGGIPTACGLDSNPFIGRVIKDSGHKW
jgi:hypothetical protein